MTTKKRSSGNNRKWREYLDGLLGRHGYELLNTQKVSLEVVDPHDWSEEVEIFGILKLVGK